MIPINRTYAPIQALVDELARCGMTHAVTCPGSRNAPLSLTLAGHEGVRAVSVLDERAAGYVALGLAKATGRPVALTSTSGTAAANLLPAVVEAHEARVPLIVMTADRPPELRDTGAGQAIDQIKLYESFAKWFVEVGSHEPSRDTAVHHRALGCRAYFTAAGGRPGPVHLNFPLREPLDPEPEELHASDWEGRPDGRPWVEVHQVPQAPDAPLVQDLIGTLVDAPRGAIVCGMASEPVAAPAARLAEATGWPLLAEPTSGARCGRHDRSRVVSHYDALLRSERFAAEHAPDVVIRLGDTPTSKPLRAWLEGSRQIVIDPHATWHEPTRTAERVVVGSAAATCDALAASLPAMDRDEGWLESWRKADALAPPALEGAADPFEPKFYVALAPVLADGDVVWLSSSMPVRDVETFFPSIEADVRFLANRGANGIDGVASSALGAALASRGRCYLLTGELALLHDLSGLTTLTRQGAELTIVCVNNAGGGIFDFLPVAESAERELYEHHIATPSGIDFARVAELAGLRHVVATTPDEVRVAARSPALIEAFTDRAANVREHRRVFASVESALEGRG